MAENPDLDRQGRCFVLVPGNIDPPFRIALQGQLAVGGMDGNPLAPGDESDDIISRHRIAAFAETDQHIVDAADLDGAG